MNKFAKLVTGLTTAKRAAGDSSTPKQATTPFSSKTVSGLKKALAYLELNIHRSDIPLLFQSPGISSEVSVLVTFIQHDNISDAYLRTLHSIHSLGFAIVKVLSLHEPLITGNIYDQLINASYNQYGAILQTIPRQSNYNLLQAFMNFFTNLVSSTELNMKAKQLGNLVGMYIIRKENVQVELLEENSYYNRLELPVYMQRMDLFERLFSFYSSSDASSGVAIHPNKQPSSNNSFDPVNNNAGALPSSSASSSLPGPTMEESKYSIQDRSVKIIFLNPANRPNEEVLRTALSVYGPIVSVSRD